MCILSAYVGKSLLNYTGKSQTRLISFIIFELKTHRDTSLMIYLSPTRTAI